MYLSAPSALRSGEVRGRQCRRTAGSSRAVRWHPGPHPQEVTVILAAWATHHVVPTRLLERFAISPERTRERLHSLKQVEGVPESFVLSTCNRVECYVSLAATGDPATVAAALVDLL